MHSGQVSTPEACHVDRDLSHVVMPNFRPSPHAQHGLPRRLADLVDDVGWSRAGSSQVDGCQRQLVWFGHQIDVVIDRPGGVSSTQILSGSPLPAGGCHEPIPGDQAESNSDHEPTDLDYSASHYDEWRNLGQRISPTPITTALIPNPMPNCAGQGSPSSGINAPTTAPTRMIAPHSKTCLTVMATTFPVPNQLSCRSGTRSLCLLQRQSHPSTCRDPTS